MKKDNKTSQEIITYWGSVEYAYEKGSKGYGKFKGGFVYIFVNAEDVIDATNKIVNEFRRLEIKILRIEYLSPYIDVPWDSDEDQNKYDSLAREAFESGKFICDGFYAYEDD